MQTVVERFKSMQCGVALPQVEALVAARGTMRDYAALAHHHYRAARPGSAMRVLTLRDQRPTLVGRYTRRRAPGDEVAAVLVESMPALRCTMREWACADRYGGWLTHAERARLLADELRCISRVIIDPRWRGLGLAVRLVRWALATAETPLTEALAAMARVNPFFERAGMTAYPAPTHAHDARLRAAMEHAGIDVIDLASRPRIEARLGALDWAQRDWFQRELLRWWRRYAGRHAPPDIADALAEARQRLVCQPIYYLHHNEEGADERDPRHRD